MAMGNFCQIQSIECPYATVFGTCRDDIYPDYGICEMQGDEMPDLRDSTIRRREWAMHEVGGHRI